METIKQAMTQGAQWARALKAGDSFLGTMGEARARGLTDLAAKAFHIAAQSNLPSVIIMAGDSNNIESLGETPAPKPACETLAPELIALSTLLIGWNRAKRKGDKAGLIASGDCLAEYIDSIRCKGL